MFEKDFIFLGIPEWLKFPLGVISIPFFIIGIIIAGAWIGLYAGFNWVMDSDV